MRRFAVIGALRVTGQDTARIVHCLTEEQARELASENGIVVNRVVEVEPETPHASAIAPIAGVPKWVGVITILAAAMISVPHWLELIYWRKATVPVLGNSSPVCNG